MGVKKDCVFCKIISGEFEVERIYEDDNCIVIPDKFPASEGQSLVIIKKHVSYVMDLDDELLAHAFLITKKVGRAIDSVLKPDRTCLMVEGFEVPHVHIRLHPVYDQNGLVKNGSEISTKEQKKVAEKIKKGLN